jgi:formate dehydrogenase major subunit
VPTDLLPPAEVPDRHYPLVLMTGRRLEHWHTGAMTRPPKCWTYSSLGPTASLNPITLARYGVAPGQSIRVTTWRGSIELTARADRAIQDDSMTARMSGVCDESTLPR